MIISAKLATPGLIKIKIFRNKAYNVIKLMVTMTSPTKFYHVTQIIL